LTNLIENQNIFQDKIIIKKTNENEKEIAFLNKKRKFENFSVRNPFVLKENESWHLFQNSQLIENNQKIKEEETNKNPKEYFLLNNSLFNSFNNNKFELSSNINNLNKNINNKLVSKDEINLNKTTSNYKNIEDISSRNSTLSTNNRNINNIDIKKKNIFTVIKYNCDNSINSYESNNNNEVKVFKNKKVVYINSCLLNSYTYSKNLKKAKKVTFIGTTKRSSRFRGVSKNGNQWQVVMMHQKDKIYGGCYSSEENAARIYDILTIKKRGINSKTNFVYNISQMEKISKMNIDIKDKNINEIIENYFLSL
jgi:hypothetical protein